MTTFIQVCLYIFAAFTVIGLAAPFALAAKARQPALAVVAIIAAAWIVFVLAYAAWRLS